MWSSWGTGVAVSFSITTHHYIYVITDENKLLWPSPSVCVLYFKRKILSCFRIGCFYSIDVWSCYVTYVIKKKYFRVLKKIITIVWMYGHAKIHVLKY
jgi:hypothetical protein